MAGKMCNKCGYVTKTNLTKCPKCGSLSWRPALVESKQKEIVMSGKKKVEELTDAELRKMIETLEAEIEKDRQTLWLNERPELQKGLKEKEKGRKLLLEESDRRERLKKEKKE